MNRALSVEQRPAHDIAPAIARAHPGRRRFPCPCASFTAYTRVLLFLAVVVFALLGVILMPTLRLRRGTARIAARMFFAGAGMPIRVRGRQNLPPGQCVVVANHASYLDGVVMTAALPPRFGFVIKREMNDVPVAGLLLRRIGSEFVERFNRHKGATDARRVLRTAASGHSLVFFPEGTFTPEVGLGQIPHRRIRDRRACGLPGGAGRDPGHAPEHAGDPHPAAPGRHRRALRRSRSSPVQNRGGEDPALKLRDASRAAILAQLGEPDLAA